MLILFQDKLDYHTLWYHTQGCVYRVWVTDKLLSFQRVEVCLHPTRTAAPIDEVISIRKTRCDN